MSAFQWTLEFASYTSGAAGRLEPARILCDPRDCTTLAQGTCPCTQNHVSASECTCVEINSCEDQGVCHRPAAAFIELVRPDYLFFGRPSLPIVNTWGTDPDPVLFSYEWGGVDFSDGLLGLGVPDNGSARYLGSLLLVASVDAYGTFTVRFRAEAVYTFVLDELNGTFRDLSLSPAVLHIPQCHGGADCDDGHRCTIDTCEPESQLCRHEAIVCPRGQICLGGTCRSPAAVLEE
ncbi:MAG: hypothetical protein HY763_02670 [Planctomycetes bacterium]|nr:hypothetical protein [Planctomycetota bacterium]